MLMKNFGPTYFLVLIGLMLLGKNLIAQQTINILEGPIEMMDCDSNCIMLHASYPKPLKTNQYSITSTTFSPNTITGTQVNLNDDKFSGAIPLGFDFCFFENTYSTCYISDNGVLTFNAAYNNSACNTNTQQLLPYFNSTFADNAVLFMFMDVSPVLGGTIKYQTIGTAPFRKLVIDYQNMKIFGNTCSANTSSYQLVLYESTHIIDVFIINKVNCDTDPLNIKNYATVGIQNLGATVAYTASGKHAAMFTANQEGIRIAPSGAPDYVMKWKKLGGVVISTNTDSIYFCPNTIPYNKITAEITYNCPANVLVDTVILDKPKPHLDSLHLVQPLCNGNPTGSITVYGSGQNLPLSYSISNGPFGSSNVFTNLPPGYYSISIKDANGCRKDTNFNLPPIINLLISLDSIQKPVCPLDNGIIYVHAENGTAPYTYSWSNGDTGPICDSVGAGTYIVTVTDANGCTQILSVNVVDGGLPIVSAVLTKPLCGDSTGSIVQSISGGTPPYQIQWNNGAVTVSLTNIPSGVYNVIITDSNGCQKYMGYNLADTLKILSIKDSLATKCNLANGKATLYTSGGLPPFTYLWTPSGQTSNIANGLAAGQYVCLTTAANGCTRKDTVNILPSLGIINQISKANANCDSSNGKIYLNGVLNATGLVNTLWSNGNTSNQITQLAPGTYWVKTTDAIGCIDIDTMVLLNDGIPHLGIVSYTPPSCFGDANGSVTLTGIGGVAPYKYSLDGINFSSTAQLTNISGGSYIIYLTDANSCPNDTVVNFAQPTQILAGIQSDTVACFADENATITAFATGGTTPYQYALNGGTMQSNSIFQNIGAGNYTVTISDANNCSRDFQTTVVGPAEPLNLLLEKQDIQCFESNTGYAKIAFKGGWPPYQYSWSNGAVGTKLDNLSAMNLSVTLTDNRGCIITKDASIQQLLCCKAVVPSAFSPNNDLLNDQIKVMAISEVSAVKFSIYDRWGKRIFSTKSIEDTWDGKYNGSPCQVGVYFYLLEYQCPFKKETVIQKGDITLIR